MLAINDAMSCPWRVIATNPDGSVCIVAPSGTMVRVLNEGAGIPCVAHDLRAGITRWGFDAFIQQHPRVDTALKRRIAATGYAPVWLSREWEIEKYVRDPHPCKVRDGRAEFAAKWVDAKASGGYVEREAIMLIWEYTRREGAIHRDAACPEIVHKNDLPWAYRMAWRRSRNGGPVYIDEDKAMAIDEARMWEKYEHAAQ